MDPILSPSIKNFPFPILREKQTYVLKEIDSALASGFRYIILQAPTGFGKSAAAIAAALSLGTSYICVSTKDLQTQYARDFPFIRVAKGKNNFLCEVKDDFIRNGTYQCKPCGQDLKMLFKSLSSSPQECPHTTVEYGPCFSKSRDERNENDIEIPKEKFKCIYKTSLQNYSTINRGTKEEQVILNEASYHKNYLKWSHLKNLKKDVRLKGWRPCQYFHQLNTAFIASHSVLNYSIFLALINKKFPSRKLLILDEAHLLETEVVKFHGISISRRKWRRYIPDLIIDNHGYDISEWLEFLQKLREMMIDALDKEKGKNKVNEELLIDLGQDLERLENVIGSISINPNNWIVSDLSIFNNEVVKAELKPLDISHYCKGLLNKCDKTLMMSATILSKDMFCENIGLSTEQVKFIEVGSDFPIQHRPICPLKVAYLNYTELQKDIVKQAIAEVVNIIMTLHKDHKGIIHTTSYEQLNFIKQSLGEDNRRRLLETDPNVERDEILEEHFKTSKPTVLISPSLHLGLNLADGLSRFQVITKVPYPSLGDRWIDEKRKKNEQWYDWQTALRLIQSVGRSVRSKDDWAITYVLDSCFQGFIFRNKSILPSWFTEAIRSFGVEVLNEAIR